MRVKSKRYALVTLILGFVLSLIALFAVNPLGAGVGQVKAESNSSGPLLRYTFESDSVDGDTVLNSGSRGAAGNAQIVCNGDSADVSILDNSLLRIVQWETKTNNGYLKLPDDMFADLSEFTFTMDVLWARMGSSMTQILHFTPIDPTVSNIQSGDYKWIEFAHSDYNTGNWGYVSTPWIENSNTSKYSRSYNESDGSDNSWGGFSDIATWTLTITWDGSNISFYVENDLFGTTTITADQVHALTFNRIGGYLYDWGRSATNATFDNINLYDRCFTADEVKAYNDGLILDYDFSADTVSADGKTVYNKGLNSGWDATLEGSIGGSIKDGKLVFSRRGDSKSGAVDKNNSYLKLPSDLFYGLSEFTFSMDIDHYDAFDYTANGAKFSSLNIAYFTDNDPTTVAGVSKKFGVYFNAKNYGTDAEPDWGFYMDYDGNQGWTESRIKEDKLIKGSVRYSNFTDSQFKLTIVYKNSQLSYYWDDTLVIQTSATVTRDTINALVCNRIGGYVFDWGRSATTGEFDNVKLYNRAFSATEIADSVNERKTTTDVIITGGDDSVLTTVATGSQFTLPAEYQAENAEKVLVGYYYKGELYKPGETITVAGRAIRIKAVLMDFFMQDTAQVRLADPAGLRFKAQYGTVNYEEIAESPEWDDINNAKTFINSVMGDKGMIFTRTSAYQKFGELNFDNYVLFIDKETTPNANMIGGAVTNDKMYGITRDGEFVEATSTDAYRTVCAFAITDIKASTYDMDYYARGYISVTYKNGQGYVYTKATVNKNVKAIAESALASGIKWSEYDLAILNTYAGING